MDDDLDPSRGVIHTIFAGTIVVIVVLSAIWIITGINRAEEHVPFEPTPKEWYLP